MASKPAIDAYGTQFDQNGKIVFDVGIPEQNVGNFRQFLNSSSAFNSFSVSSLRSFGMTEPFVNTNRSLIPKEDKQSLFVSLEPKYIAPKSGQINAQQAKELVDLKANGERELAQIEAKQQEELKKLSDQVGELRKRQKKKETQDKEYNDLKAVDEARLRAEIEGQTQNETKQAQDAAKKMLQPQENAATMRKSATLKPQEKKARENAAKQAQVNAANKRKWTQQK